MKPKSFLQLMIAIVFISSNLWSQVLMNKEVIPPKAEKIPQELVTHGDTRIDNYFWMNQRDDQKVLDYLNAENSYTSEVMKKTEDFQQKLYDEIIGRIKQDDQSVPYKKNGYYYYTKYEEGKEYPIYCRKKGSLDAEEEVLLNVNEMAEGYAYYSVSGLNVSPDNKMLAFGVDTLSRRNYDIYIKNLETGDLLDYSITKTTGGSVWANDNKTLFYTRKDEQTLRAYKIFKHRINETEDNDKLVFHETDEEFSTFVYKTKSNKFIIIGSSQTVSNEYRFIDADTPDAEFKIIQSRERDLEYSLDHFGEHFYIVTNYNAKNFKVVKTPIDNTIKENWEDVIPHRNDVLVEGIEIFRDYFVVQEKSNALDQIRIINWEDGKDYYVEFQDEVYTARPSTNPEYDTDKLRFIYSSLVTPTSTYDYNMTTKERELMKQDEVLGDFDSNNYDSKRLYAIADDGTKIPISIVYRKGINTDGNNPTLLYGYGSYGYSQSAFFRSSILSLLDRGFIYALAHIRGGQELGRDWYDDGKLLNKINTFTDFIDCSEYLIEENYTNPDKLFIYGGSAGGLLVGAVVNMAPQLFKGAMAAVPFVDVVTTMLDDSIPLTTFEYDEWGNPNAKVYYDYMLSYSPYDQVKAQDYPNMLITTGYHDSQVQYWEPAKWVAKLREMKTDNNLLLFDCDMDSGHGGASGRFKAYKKTALQYAFMLDLVGIEE
ncbi:MAG: S9 family peptidase [Melioribacteraceae bacterium]|nr:MAG: S9 family peptidase [Melioribacteraceae bacterium]